MNGETCLRTLIANMSPEMLDDEYVLCPIEPDSHFQSSIDPIGWFREKEGISVIVNRASADSTGLNYGPIFRIISLQVHSSPEAVGFLSAVTSELASAGLSANAISAYHHDHLLVLREQATTALKVLCNMMKYSS